MRKIIHQHKTEKTQGPYPFLCSLSGEPSPAHGGYSEIRTCSCGWVQDANLNAGFEEAGSWYEPDEIRIARLAREREEIIKSKAFEKAIATYKQLRIGDQIDAKGRQGVVTRLGVHGGYCIRWFDSIGEVYGREYEKTQIIDWLYSQFERELRRNHV